MNRRVILYYQSKIESGFYGIPTVQSELIDRLIEGLFNANLLNKESCRQN